MTRVTTDWEDFRASLVIQDDGYFLKFYGIKDGAFHELQDELIPLDNFFKHLEHQIESQTQ